MGEVLPRLYEARQLPAPVRWAFLSDIHANLDALGAVLEHLAGQGAEHVFALGDLVGYNAEPNEVLRRLRKESVLCLQGNHDRAVLTGDPAGFNPYATAGVLYTRRILDPEQRAWLASLPEVRDVAVPGLRAKLVHGSPRDPLAEYVFPGSPAWLFEELADVAGNPDVVAMGHTHVPMRVDDRTLFLNPGSVGQPRDGDPRASYCVLDTTRRSTEFHRVAYDVESAAAKVRAAGLPDVLWQRLLRGV
jgi:putative phosphoesterase